MRKMIGRLPIIFRIQILGIILPSHHHSRAHRHSAFSFSDFLLAQQALRLNRTSQVCVGRYQSYEHRRASLILSATFSRAWLVTGDWPLANPISPSWMWVKFVKPASSRVLRAQFSGQPSTATIFAAASVLFTMPDTLPPMPARQNILPTPFLEASRTA